MPDPAAAFSRAVRDQFRQLYTLHFGIIDAYDEETHRATVVHKDDDAVIVDNVPIASPYAGDAFGERYPIEPGVTEGILCTMRDPIDTYLTERGFLLEGIAKQRQHHLRDAIFFPRIHFDPDEVPIVEQLLEGMVGPTGFHAQEYLLWHESDSWWRITSPETGGNIDIVHNGDHYLHFSDEVGIRARHISGHEIQLNEEGAVLRAPGGTTATITDAAATLTSADGASTATVSDSEVALDTDGVRVVTDGTEGRIAGAGHVTENLTVDGDLSVGGSLTVTGEFAADSLSATSVEADTATVSGRLSTTPQDVRTFGSPTAGDTAYHDGAGSNTEGPAHYNGLAWISDVDGTTIS